MHSFRRVGDFNDVRLPFFVPSFITSSAHKYTEMGRKALESIDYIQSNAERVYDLAEYYPRARKNRMYSYLQKLIEEDSKGVYILPDRVEVQTSSEVMSGMWHTTESSSSSVSPYGAKSLLAFYVIYDENCEAFIPYFAKSKLDRGNRDWGPYNINMLPAIKGVDQDGQINNFANQDNIFNVFKDMFVLYDCIYIANVPATEVMFTGHYTKDMGATTANPYAPVLGKYIKQDEMVMDRLKPWLDSGMKISDEVAYVLISGGRFPYLKRDLNISPKPIKKQ